MSSRGKEKRTKMSQEPQLQLRPLCKRVSNPSMRVSLHRKEREREGGRERERERERVGRKSREEKRKERMDTGTFIIEHVTCSFSSRRLPIWSHPLGRCRHHGAGG